MGTLLDTASAWFIRALEFIMVIMMIARIIVDARYLPRVPVPLKVYYP